MKFCKVIQNKFVLQSALKLVRSAHKEILATMDMTREIKSPLPVKYHRLIAHKASEGMVIKRLGFGPKRAFTMLVKQNAGIRFVYAGEMNAYQRLLIVDRRRGMFGLGETIFYTEFVPLIDSLVKYTEIIYNKPA